LRYGSVVGGNSIICPKCGSGNVVGLAGEWGCFDCGYKFKVSTVGVRTTPLAPEAGKPPVEKAKPILDRRAETGQSVQNKHDVWTRDVFIANKTSPKHKEL
jgi:hypothetical protein